MSQRQVLAPADPPCFDEAAAEALAVLTLLATGDEQDGRDAERIVRDLLAVPGGERRVAHGLTSVCAGLLALLEFFGGVPPAEGLRELGRLIAQAGAADALG